MPSNCWFKTVREWLQAGSPACCAYNSWLWRSSSLKIIYGKWWLAYKLYCGSSGFPMWQHWKFIGGLHSPDISIQSCTNCPKQTAFPHIHGDLIIAAWFGLQKTHTMMVATVQLIDDPSMNRNWILAAVYPSSPVGEISPPCGVSIFWVGNMKHQSTDRLGIFVRRTPFLLASIFVHPELHNWLPWWSLNYTYSIPREANLY